MLLVFVLALSLYLIIAFVFFALSATEVAETGGRSLRLALAGLMAALWPASVLITLLAIAATRMARWRFPSVRRHRPQSSGLRDC